MKFPHLVTNSRDINRAYRLATANLASNILPFKDGILEKEEPVIIAGLGYSTPWTRDAAINTWNAGGLVCPEEALSTLKSVLAKHENGYIIDGEYWDRIIWTVGAWWLYLYTGDKDFLALAYNAVCNSLADFEENEFTPELNLFRGPACYGDGVAAYPDIYAKHGTSAIVDFVKANPDLIAKKGFGMPMHSLSTNCLYFEAYVLADKMAAELGFEAKFEQKAQKMKDAINEHFWNEKNGNYDYLVDDFGGCESQEGLGISFAMLFDVASDEQKEKIFKTQFISDYGITCVHPSFARYDTPDGLGIGRHSGSVWPHVQGFWADAAAQNGKKDVFDKEFKFQTDNALRYMQFAEIYHPTTGEMYGGRQERGLEKGISMWNSEPYQTWSATAYLRNVYMDLVGLKFTNKGIEFKPVCSTLVNKVVLKNLDYRDATLNIQILGEGNEIKSFKVNGENSAPFVSKDIKGIVNIEIELG